MRLVRKISFKGVFVFSYVFSFLIYLLIGFLPAEATNPAANGDFLEISAIGLSATVIDSRLTNGILEVPDLAIGRYSRAENKVFLFGHSTTAFLNLNKISLRDKIGYGGKLYKVIARDIILKDDIDMAEVLARAEKDTVVMMTCAGLRLEDNDSTHRLIVTAEIID